ncbi:MAG: hypothetical protein QOI61_2580 [Actinomycetota bacterium]|jgi:uncharacterized protein (DUF1697 family)
MGHAFAFLRGINLGGHNVKKDQLITIYESLGLTGVATFIASGNVVFDKPSGSVAALEKQAEDAFRAALGYEAATFIRTPAQLKAIVKQRPFDGRGPETGGTLHVSFLKRNAKPAEVAAVRAFEDDINEFHFHGTTLYWHTHTARMSDSGVDATKLQKAIGQPHTARSIKTILNVIEKWPT